MLPDLRHRDLKLPCLIQLAPVEYLVRVDPMPLSNSRSRNPRLQRLLYNQSLLLDRPVLSGPSPSTNQRSGFHPYPSGHGNKPCLQRA